MKQGFMFDEARRQSLELGGRGRLAETPADFALPGGTEFQVFADEMLRRLREDREQAIAGGFNTWHREALTMLWAAIQAKDPDDRERYLAETASVCRQWSKQIEAERTVEPDSP